MGFSCFLLYSLSLCRSSLGQTLFFTKLQLQGNVTSSLFLCKPQRSAELRWEGESSHPHSWYLQRGLSSHLAAEAKKKNGSCYLPQGDGHSVMLSTGLLSSFLFFSFFSSSPHPFLSLLLLVLLSHFSSHFHVAVLTYWTVLVKIDNCILLIPKAF